MRWCLFILNLFLLLTLSAEQCWWSGAAVGQETSHLVCVLDDDEAELKLGLVHESACTDCTTPDMPDWHEVILRQKHADLVALPQGADNWALPTGIRRHRWLCQERC